MLELEPDPENIDTLVEDLRKIVKEQGLSCPTSEAYLLRSLRCTYFKKDRALSQIENLTRLKTKFPDLFENWDYSFVDRCFTKNICDFLPQHAYDGRRVWYLRMANLDFSECPAIQYLSLLLWGSIVMSETEELQRNGAHLVTDFGGFGLSQIRSFGFRELLIFMTMLQDCVPIKFESLHVVNNGYVTGMLLKMAISLANEQTKGMMFIHGHNYEKLYQHFPKSILPSEVKGDTGKFTANQDFIPSYLKKSVGRDWTQYI